MPAGRNRPWLLCYDIADPRRLQRVHRVARRHGTPLQYSLFHIAATRRDAQAVLAWIEPEIDPRADDVRIYPLSTLGRAIVRGRGRVADGVLALDPPMHRLAECGAAGRRGG